MNDYLFPLYLFGTALLGLFAVSLTTFLFFQRRRQITHKLEKENLKILHQNELLSARLEIQEQSMSLISEEIHDNVGQLLTLTQTYLSMLKKSGGESSNLVDRSYSLVSQAVTDLRHISHSLNGKLIAEMGLISFLEKDIEHLNNSLGIRFELTMDGDDFTLTQEQNLLVYRIIQECIQNVLKHADAKHLQIKLAYSKTILTIEVLDDGKGFDMGKKNHESLGLRNIHQRAKLLHAELKISSTFGEGTQIVLCVPKNREHA